MDYQEAAVDHGLAFPIATGNSHLSLYVQSVLSSDASPGAQSWKSDVSQRKNSRSSSLYTVPSTGSNVEFPTTPPSNSSLRLPQALAVPAIRHRTAQACDKCRERKTKCSGHPICIRCSNRGLQCKYSMRETRIRGAVKTGSSTSTDGQPYRHDSQEENVRDYGLPTPAYHSRLGYSQTTAFARPPENSTPLELSRPVYTTSPVGSKPHYIEEEFHWQPCNDHSSKPVAFRFESLQDAISVPGPQKPVSVSIPFPERLDEFQSHLHAQTTLACPTIPSPSTLQESSMDDPNPNHPVYADDAIFTLETGQILLSLSEVSALRPSTPFPGDNTFLADADYFASSSYPRDLSAFQKLEGRSAHPFITNNHLDRFALNELAFFC